MSPPAPGPLRSRRTRLDLAARASRGLPEVARPTWMQRLDGSDPGSVRLAMSVRAVVNLVVVLAAMALTAALLGLSGTPRTVVLILGCVLAMITTFTASDPTPRARAVTTLALPVAMLAMIALSTLVDHHRVLSLVMFVVVMIAVVWVRRFGPRAFACGMVAWIGYFITLFLQLSVTQLPLVLVSLAVTTVVLLLLTGVITPQSPSRRLRRMVDALLARVQIARWDAARGRHAGTPGSSDTSAGPDEHKLAVAMLRTNEVAVLVDGQLGLPGAVRKRAAAPVVRAAVLRVELALASLLEAEVEYAADLDGGDAAAVAAASQELDAALDRLTTVVADDRAGRSTPPPAPDDPVEDGFTPGTILFGGFLPGSAITVGAMFDPDARDRPAGVTGPGPGAPRTQPGTEMARIDEQPAAAGTAGTRPWWRPDLRLSLTTRQAVQIGVASALAIVLGDIVSGQRWYWAVLACFLAFTGTATAAEATRKAGQRTVGTLVGVVIALPLLPLLGHGVAVGLTTMFVALFIGFYFFRVSYTVLAVAITVLVAELYELMGSFSQQILYLRIGETLLGAVVGGIVAVCVLPTSSRHAESAARAQLAEDLRDALDDVAALIRRGRSAGPAVDLHHRLRALDADVHQLAVIGVPMLRREVPGTRVPRATVRRRIAAWATAAIRVRAVVHAVEDAPTGRVPNHPQVARAIASVHALAEGAVLLGGAGAHGSSSAAGGGGGERAGRAWGSSEVAILGDAAAGASSGRQDDAEVNRLRELAALHGALVALHEIDGRSDPAGAADEPTRSPLRPAVTPLPRAASPAPGAAPAAPSVTPSSGVRLVGTAHGQGGAPADVVLTLIDANGRQRGRARAVGGRYDLLLPGPGTWQLVVGARGHTPRADRVVVPALPDAGPRVVRHDITLEAADPLLVGHRGPSVAPL